jgi:hypothetical protein
MEDLCFYKGGRGSYDEVSKMYILMIDVSNTDFNMGIYKLKYKVILH